MKIRNKKRKRSSIVELTQEIDVMKDLKHPNIVRYLGTEVSGQYLNIFLEFVPGGSLDTLLGYFGKFVESVIRNYTRQILLGLKYLHDNNIIHRDIKGLKLFCF